jgi:hypothetical protein
VLNLIPDDGDVDGLVSEDDEQVTARPRRMSEVNAVNKVIPIPAASSFFVFSQTNRFLSFFYLFHFEFLFKNHTKKFFFLHFF